MKCKIAPAILWLLILTASPMIGIALWMTILVAGVQMGWWSGMPHEGL